MEIHQPTIPTKYALALIFFIMLMDIVGLTILAPVAPYIVRRYSNDALMVTLLSVIYAVAQFFAAPLLGKLGDRNGRRPVLLVSVFGSAIGYIIFGVGGTLWILFLSRLIDGISGGNLSTAAAYIADISKPEERAKNFALIGVAWGVGLVLGPALGGLASQISLEAPAYTAAILSGFGLFLAFFLLPESLPAAHRETTALRINDLNPFVSIGDMLRKPGLGRLLFALCLFNFAFNGINTTQGLFFIYRFDAQPWQIGLLLVLIGIAVAAVQLVVQRLVARYGEKTIAILSLFGQAVGAVLTFLAPIFWIVYVLTVLTNAISAFTFPTLTTLSSNRVAAREQGTLMGVNTALNSLMSILGPLWAGIIYDHLFVGAPYWSGAALFVLSALLLIPFRSDN